MSEPATLIDVPAFDAVSAAAATELLRPACASPAWLHGMASGRPYVDLDSVMARSEALLAQLDWAQVLLALAAHPRIGQRPTGGSREDSWSRQEQAAASGGSGAPGADEDVAVALREANVAYEQHFGHVYLICATGRNQRQILAALTERLDNEPALEQAVVRRELAAIVGLRLAKTLQ